MSTLKELKDVIDSARDLTTGIDDTSNIFRINEKLLKAQILIDIINQDLNKIANISRRKG